VILDLEDPTQGIAQQNGNLATKGTKPDSKGHKQIVFVPL